MNADRTNNKKKTTRQRERRGNAAKILKVAAELFAERGFAGVSIRDIGAGANVHGATIYHHFKSKRKLYIAVLQSALEAQTQKHIEILEGPGDERARLRTFLLNLIESLSRDDVDRRLIERMFNDPLEWAPPVTSNRLAQRFQQAMKRVIGNIVAGGQKLPWESISSAVNGVPHGLFRSRRVHRHLVRPQPLHKLCALADVVNEVVIATLTILVRHNRRAKLTG